MKLSMLRESIGTTTGAIAVGPMVGLGERPKKKKRKSIKEGEAGSSIRTGYMGISGQDQPTNSVSSVWEPLDQPTKKGKMSWEKKYAADNDPDTRLLKNFRGKGF